MKGAISEQHFDGPVAGRGLGRIAGAWHMVHCVVLSQRYDPLCVQQNVVSGECIRQQEIQYSASCYEACCRIPFCLEADAAGCTSLVEWKHQGRKNCL